jgi:hypothetical protein
MVLSANRNNRMLHAPTADRLPEANSGMAVAAERAISVAGARNQQICSVAVSKSFSATL